MYNFFVDLFIWTFAIYGFIKFVGEFIGQFFSYILLSFISITTFFKKFIAKNPR